MSVKRVTLLRCVWVLAAAAFGSVFLGGCMVGNEDVDKPLEWSNAWTIPINFDTTIDLGGYLDFDSTIAPDIKENIVDILPPDLDQSAKEAIASVISGNDKLTSSMDTTAAFRKELYNFMESDPEAARELLGDPEVRRSLGDTTSNKLDGYGDSLKVIHIVNELPGGEDVKVDSLIQDVGAAVDESLAELNKKFGEFLLPLGAIDIPALGDLDFMGIENADSLTNILQMSFDPPLPVPLRFYALLYKKEERRGKNKIDIESLDSLEFFNFMKNGDFRDNPDDYINLFEDGNSIGLRIDGNGEGVRIESNLSVLLEMLKTEGSVGLRMTAKYEGKVEELLKLKSVIESQKIQLRTKLSIKIKLTNGFEQMGM